MIAYDAMYEPLLSRTREIATLRALGFGNFPVVFSVLSELTEPELIARDHRE